MGLPLKRDWKQHLVKNIAARMLMGSLYKAAHTSDVGPSLFIVILFLHPIQCDLLMS